MNEFFLQIPGPPASCDPELKAILLDEAHLLPGVDGMTLDDVLESYSRAAAAGYVSGKEQLLQRHPRLTNAVEAFFAESAARARRQSPPIIPRLDDEYQD